MGVLLALGLAGCSTPTSPVRGSSPAAVPVPPAPVPAPAAPPALAQALAVEQRWLLSWFGGTPVRITRQGDGAVHIEVPREFCFEPGRDALQPAVLAVLDKVAQSLRRVPAAQLLRVAAPGDAAGGTALALRRAGRLQRHLRSRSIAAARLAAPSVAPAEAVQLWLGAAPEG